MLESGTEIITLENDTVYSPTFVSTDKRIPLNGRTTLGYWQIGEDQQYGNSKGPVFKIEFVDFSGVNGSATHVKIWGIDNNDDNLAPLYPLTYIADHPIIHVYLQKFLFCDSSGNAVDPEGAYTVVGYKKRVLPLAW
jgi:hypothetical protein